MNSRVLPALALILATGIFFGYVKPTWSGPIADSKTAIAANNVALAAADEYNKKRNALASARNGIEKEDFAKLAVFLPDSVDNVALILDINALAARSGLSLSNIDVAKGNSSQSQSQTSASVNITGPATGGSSSGTLQKASQTPIGSVDLSLSAIGTYSALKTFLIGLEKSARLLDVTQMTIKGSETGVYNYEMTVRLYWLR